MTVPAQPVPYDTAGSDAGTTPYETDFAQAAALIADPTRPRSCARCCPTGRWPPGSWPGSPRQRRHGQLPPGQAAPGPDDRGARQGRHRYYRLAGHEIAAALEALGLISPALPVRSLRQSREAAALADARTCYDHLAGRAGVELLDALLRRGLLAKERPPSLSRTNHGDSGATRFEVTGAGAVTLGSFG